MVTPSGKQFIPPMDFAKLAIKRNKNKRQNYGEVFFLRQTGRTTNMILNALIQAKNGYKVAVRLYQFSDRKRILKDIKHYADQMKIGHSAVDNIMLFSSEKDLIGYDFDVMLVDNAVYDSAVSKISIDTHYK